MTQCPVCSAPITQGQHIAIEDELLTAFDIKICPVCHKPLQEMRAPGERTDKTK